MGVTQGYHTYIEKSKYAPEKFFYYEPVCVIMKKKIISLFFAALLICTMAVPAHAVTLSSSGTYNGFLYMTTDSCYTNRYYCVIEANSADYTIGTDVTWYTYDYASNTHRAMSTDAGTQTYMLSTNSGNSDSFVISQICCVYKVGGVQASHQFVPA